MDRLQKIYAERKTFGDFVKQDLGVWFNEFEFARLHNINGDEVLSVLTSDKTTQNIFNTDGEKISGESFILYASRDDIRGVMSGQSVEIDGKLYVVQDAQDLQGVFWKIKLTGDIS